MRPIDTAFTAIVYPLHAIVSGWMVATGDRETACGVAIVCVVLLVVVGCAAAVRAWETRRRVRFTTVTRTTHAD